MLVLVPRQSRQAGRCQPRQLTHTWRWHSTRRGGRPWEGDCHERQVTVPAGISRCAHLLGFWRGNLALLPGNGAGNAYRSMPNPPRTLHPSIHSLSHNFFLSQSDQPCVDLISDLLRHNATIAAALLKCVRDWRAAVTRPWQASGRVGASAKTHAHTHATGGPWQLR